MNEFIPTKVVITDSKGNSTTIDSGGPFRILLIGEYIAYPIDAVGKITIETDNK